MPRALPGSGYRRSWASCASPRASGSIVVLRPRRNQVPAPFDATARPCTPASSRRAQCKSADQLERNVPPRHPGTAQEAHAAQHGAERLKHASDAPRHARDPSARRQEERQRGHVERREDRPSPTNPAGRRARRIFDQRGCTAARGSSSRRSTRRCGSRRPRATCCAAKPASRKARRPRAVILGEHVADAAEAADTLQIPADASPSTCPP